MEKKYPIDSGNAAYPGSYYQPLFDHMQKEHGTILTTNSLDDIMHIVQGMQPTGAVWVKAIKFKYEVGVAYHAKDSRSKGAGHFNSSGAFIWGDSTVTWPKNQEDLLILDEGKAATPATLTLGAPETTGQYFAVVRHYLHGTLEYVVLHYLKHKEEYHVKGHALDRMVKKEDVYGYVRVGE
jgi:hypothetical protein